MNFSYQYHAFGVRHQESTKTEYKCNLNIHYFETRKRDYVAQSAKDARLSVQAAYIKV